MKKRPVTIAPDVTIKDALFIMHKNNSTTLPVVEDKLFIGIIQKDNLLQYESNESTQPIRSELSDNYDRIIGNYHSNNEKTMIFTAAIHGNENSGVIALKRFFKDIKMLDLKIEGTVIGIIGNINALTKNVRFIDVDMNRIWDQKEKPTKPNSEEKEVIILKSLLILI